MPKSRIPTSLAGFTALPVEIRSKALGRDVTHYIYMKAYEPKIPDEESPRALFLVNIPVTTNEAQIRHLFSTQLGGAHVQSVYFAEQNGGASNLIATTKGSGEQKTSLGKRKRAAAESSEDVARRLEGYTLPDTVPGVFHSTGSTCIAIFLDRASRDLTLRAAQKAARHKPIVWGTGLDVSKAPLLGIKRYEAQRALTYPPRAELLKLVDEYMTGYAELEAARSAEASKRRAEPDEDGFITVTRGSKGVVKSDEAEAVKARLAATKKGGLEDFYRFQMRERRREEQGKLLRQFDDERRRVGEMRQRRGGG